MPKQIRVWVWLSVVFALLGAFVWLVVVNRVLADAAPDPQSVGGDGRGAEPANVTAVRMVSETVVMEVQNLPFESPILFGPGRLELLGARVTADFLFHNPGAQAESLPVGFPLYLTPANRVPYPEIWRLRSFVNSAEVLTNTTQIQGDPWAIWDMTFPPGETRLRVTYDVIVRANFSSPAAQINYILHTGAGWADSIGQADIIVRFPYLAEPTFIDTLGTLPGYTIDGFDVRWHFADLEPTRANDVVLKVVRPDTWLEVGRARQAVMAERSAQNYWNLARAYGDIINDYYVLATGDDLYSFYSPLLAQTAEAQYLKAIELDPSNRELRQELTEFVMKWEGLLLPANESLVLTQIAATPIATATPLLASDATATAPPPTIAPNASATIETATAIAQASTATPASIASHTPPPGRPAATPVPPEPSSVDFTPWLIGLLVIVILFGLGIALRKPAK